MNAIEKRRLLEELEWHHPTPRRVLEILTEAEAADILKRGYVTKKLWDQVALRIPAEPLTEAASDG